MRHSWLRHSGSGNSPATTKSEALFNKDFTERMDKRQQHLVTRKTKRFRSAFTTDQVNYLEKQFKKFPYIGNTHRKEVANALNIPERAVKIWFQNRRMKEKKEANGKDQHDVDDKNSRKNAEIVNNQLNNAIAVPSTNEPRLISLPQLTTSDVETITKPNTNGLIRNIETKVQEQPLKLNFYNNISPTKDEIPVPPKVHYDTPQPFPIYGQTNFRSSAEFSIDLCKKYKNNFNNPEQEVKPVFENNNSHKLTLTPSHMRQPVNQLPKIEHQNSPEDLSFKRSATERESISLPNVGSDNPGYIPVYVNYPQPYISAGNMLWKPVNVLPIMPAGVQPKSMAVTQDQNIQKKKCNCDCHAANPLMLPETTPNPQAQYVITALPFQNYHKF